MTEWIIPCNPGVYDVIGAFNALDMIDWKQSTNIEVDDIVYIYVAKPVGAIRFKCVVRKVNMEDSEIDDINYVIDDPEYADYGRYMQLQLVEKYDTPKLSYYQLQINGLKTVQGPSMVPKQLSDYIFASTETLTGQRITRRHAVEILARVYDRPVTARNFTNIIYEIGKHQSAIFGELNFLAESGEMKKEGTPAQYYFSPAVKQPTPHYYYVFQGRSFDEECKDGFLWAPRNGNNGPAKHHWSRMGEVKKGDVILHGKQGRFVAVSVVKKDSYVSRRPNTDVSEKWADDGWCIETDYFVFPHAVRIKDYWDRIREIQPSQYGPFNKNGDGNWGYLFAANQELARFLLDATAGMTDFDGHIPVKGSAPEGMQPGSIDSDVETESLPEEKWSEIFGVNNDEDRRLIEELRQASLSNAQDDFEYEDGAKEKPAAIYINGHRTYPRDRQTAVNALSHAHYLCEIDAGHPTFVRKNSDKNYTEPHHLIPLSFSDQFPVSLDREQNIVSLCSNCHNLIHYGRDAGKLLKVLYHDRKGALQSIGVNITYDQLLAMYQIKPEDADDEAD